MSTEVPIQSAVIYQFPAGGRRKLARRSAMQVAVQEPVAEPVAARVPVDAWYHEAAMQDAKRAGER